ncbi:hypothetical protein [Streptomyces broussonetiae]
MNLPVAPPVFDATDTPVRHERADTGADIGAGYVRTGPPRTSW